MLKALLKWLSIILCFTLVFTLTSCQNQPNNNQDDQTQEEQPEDNQGDNTQEEQPEDNEEQPENPNENEDSEEDNTHSGELPWI